MPGEGEKVSAPCGREGWIRCWDGMEWEYTLI